MVGAVMRAWLLLALVACDPDGEIRPDAALIPPTPNPAREIVETKLGIDLVNMTGNATIFFGPSETPGASLEIGDLEIDFVLHVNTSEYAITGSQLDLGLPASEDIQKVDIQYRLKLHENFDGASEKGYTFLWPYYCGNVFPCHSQPSDGTTFTFIDVRPPIGQTVIAAREIPADAPAYQLAWAVGDYTEIALGTTSRGTRLSVWHLPNEAQAATAGTKNLVAAFDWLEQTIGRYRFGDNAGTVSVAWGPGAYGGMEHHPFWHVGSGSLASEETNVHEAAHGWFGAGIRIECWEDFVLSEGTTTYLAARALDVVAPTVGAETWASYESELGGIRAADPVWPQSCGEVDILEDNLFTNAPYIRGAFFYKGVADKVGADKLDEALAAFYEAHAGGSATMADMLDTIKTVTGYDATTCADMWLRSTTKPAPGACP